MIIRLITSICLAVCMILFIYISTDLPNQANNGFNRNFIQINLKHTFTQPLGTNIFDILDLEENILYLSNFSSLDISIYDLETKTISLFPLYKEEDSKTLPSKSFEIYKRLNDFYIFQGNESKVIHINPHNNFFETSTFKGPKYSYGIPISNDSFILRQFTDNAENKLFIKRNTSSDIYHIENNISLLSNDGGFSTDGKLLYDGSNLLTYVHYYNNNVLVFDTCLNTIKKFNTIDTIHPKLSLKGHIPLTNTQNAALYKNHLFISSNLKADNENFKKYKANIPIDIYQVNTGMYKGSFYIPSLHNQLIKSMYINLTQIVVIYYNNYISLYSFTNFPEDQS